jgi:hypothetical protein
MHLSGVMHSRGEASRWRREEEISLAAALARERV